MLDVKIHKFYKRSSVGAGAKHDVLQYRVLTCNYIILPMDTIAKDHPLVQIFLILAQVCQTPLLASFTILLFIRFHVVLAANLQFLGKSEHFEFDAKFSAIKFYTLSVVASRRLLYYTLHLGGMAAQCLASSKQVFTFSLRLRRFSSGAPTSSHSPKTCTLGWNVNGCLLLCTTD